MTILDSSEVVAQALKQHLEESKLINPGMGPVNHQFLVSRLHIFVWSIHPPFLSRAGKSWKTSALGFLTLPFCEFGRISPELSTLLLFFLFYCSTLLVIYAERKVSAFIQDRLGPMETGPYGIVQSIADFIKLIQKEDIVPAKADRLLVHTCTIIVIFLAVFVGFAVIPLALLPGPVQEFHPECFFFLLLFHSM